MLFMLVRLFILIILGMSLFFFLKHAKTMRKKKLTLIFGIILIILFTECLSVIPFENLFIKFNTAEDAFHYENTSKIIGIIKGKDSALILSSGGTVIIPKEGDHWIIPYIGIAKSTEAKFSESNLIFVKHYPNSQDYYVTFNDIFDKNFASLSVNDSQNSKFTRYHYMDKDIDVYVFAAIFTKYDEHYSVTINGYTTEFDGKLHYNWEIRNDEFSSCKNN